MNAKRTGRGGAPRACILGDYLGATPDGGKGGAPRACILEDYLSADTRWRERGGLQSVYHERLP